MPRLTDYYRPRSFEEVIGNIEVVRAIKSKVHSESIPGSFLITGPSGCGKTTLGRIIAAELGAYDHNNQTMSVNYKELDSASFTGIDTIRSIRSAMHKAPIGKGKKRVWLLDEMHQLTGNAQEALLKALEEPPSHAHFILCTTDPQKLKKTLIRRCAHFELVPVSDDVLTKLLLDILEDEGVSDVTEDSKILQRILRASDGSPGIALSHLDQIIDMTPDERANADIVSQQIDAEVIELARALHSTNNWKTVAKILKKLKGTDPETIRRIILGYASSVHLSKGDDISFFVLDSFREPFYNVGFPGVVHACAEIVRG
jgi:DNA polymerase III subunit gamma/tau